MQAVEVAVDDAANREEAVEKGKAVLVALWGQPDSLVHVKVDRVLPELHESGAAGVSCSLQLSHDGVDVGSDRRNEQAGPLPGRLCMLLTSVQTQSHCHLVRGAT